MSILKQHYDMKEDWGGELYCGITLTWNYAEEYVDIAMPIDTKVKELDLGGCVITN